jgi:ABC-type polysaccharide/polyol phosphate transport system ATPase subunit
MYEIELKNVGLKYDLYYDKTTNLKEFVLNLFKGGKKGFSKEKDGKLAALSDINLHFKEGDRIGIIGPNGAGKSTLLKITSGVLHPTTGSIHVQGNIQPLIEVGAGFNPEFSGRENIFLNGYMLGFTKQQIKTKEKEIVEFSELEDFIDVPIKYYSSGMAVRLAFAIATSIEPEILVFDEMLSAGDIHFMEKAKQRMNSLLEMAKILVFVSHDLKLVETLCKEVIVVSKGQIVYRGKPKDAIEYYKREYA